MPKLYRNLLAAMAAVLAIGISSSAFAWQVEGKVDAVSLAPGAYNGATSFIFIAPKNTFPIVRWRVTNKLDRCNNLASDALGDNMTVIFSGPGVCVTQGNLSFCPGEVTRCVSYRNR